MNLPKKNILANYIGQIYVMAISIFVMPLYLKYMGAEAYGLVGFFILMQVFLNLLDAGFSPTLGRQVAEARGNQEKFKTFFRILRSVEIIFFLLSVTVILLVYTVSYWISAEWIKADSLGQDTIQYCIVLMGIILSIRWFTTVYKSGINGFEDQVWLNKVNILIATLKYLGALLLLIFISQDIKVFFYYQLMIGIIEVIFLNLRMYKLLPINEIKSNILSFKIDITAMKTIIPFSMSIAYTTLIWTLLMQFDKLILSSVLSLDKFGYFSIIILISSSLVAIATPVFLAISPQMTVLLSAGESIKMKNVYRKMTQLITWIVLSTSLLICIFSKEILYILIGDLEASIWGSNILIFYTLGYAFFVLGSFQYYLQNSFGDLRYYVRGASVLVFFQIPLMYYFVVEYGAIGSGVLWLFFNFLWFIVFTFIIHNKFLPKFHLKWLLKDMIPILIFVVLLAFLVKQFIHFEISILTNKWILASEILIIGILFVLVSSLSISIVQEKIKNLINKKVKI
jgi:O-antigen/teichoic acid export membrane protein